MRDILKEYSNTRIETTTDFQLHNLGNGHNRHRGMMRNHKIIVFLKMYIVKINNEDIV